MLRHSAHYLDQHYGYLLSLRMVTLTCFQYLNLLNMISTWLNFLNLSKYVDTRILERDAL